MTGRSVSDLDPLADQPAALRDGQLDDRVAARRRRRRPARRRRHDARLRRAGAIRVSVVSGWADTFQRSSGTKLRNASRSCPGTSCSPCLPPCWPAPGWCPSPAPAQAANSHNGDVNDLVARRGRDCSTSGDGSTTTTTAPRRSRLHLYVGGIYSDSERPVHRPGRHGRSPTGRPEPPIPGVGRTRTTGFDRTVEVAKYGNQPIFLYALNAVGDSDHGPAVLVGGAVRQTSRTRTRTASSLSADLAGCRPGDCHWGCLPARRHREDARWSVNDRNGTLAGTLVADQRGPGFEDFPVMFNGTVPSPGRRRHRVRHGRQPGGVGSDQ